MNHSGASANPGRDSTVAAKTAGAVPSDMMLAGLVLLWFAATAWLRPLALPDEGRYVGVAWEMLRSGDWLTPTLNGLPYFHKPPLFYWITAASMSVFGVNEWAARAAPILGAWLGTMALYLFVRRWHSERLALHTLLALLAQPLFYIGGQFANLDMLVAAFITATIVLLAHATLSIEQGRPYRGALRAAYAMSALAILSKGLIGAVIPALVLLGWLGTTRRWRTLPHLLSPSGAALFLLLTAPWLIAMQWKFPDFLDYFIVVQHFRRFAAGGFNNPQPVWFYPAVLLVFSLPGLPWLYRHFTRAPAVVEPGRAISALMWLWTLVVVVFFSIPQSKLLGYILPAVPPLACLMADGFLGSGVLTVRMRRLGYLSLALSALAGVAAVVILALYPRESFRHHAAILSAQRAPDEPLFMVRDYYYDLPFYAQLKQPVGVVHIWTSPRAQEADDSHKELADAARFAPRVADPVLLESAAFTRAVCRSRASWVIGHSSWVGAYPILLHARQVYVEHHTTLWQFEPQTSLAACREAGTTDGPRNSARMP